MRNPVSKLPNAAEVTENRQTAPRARGLLSGVVQRCAGFGAIWGLGCVMYRKSRDNAEKGGGALLRLSCLIPAATRGSVAARKDRMGKARKKLGIFVRTVFR